MIHLPKEVFKLTMTMTIFVEQEDEMPPEKERYQVTINLSQKAYEEMEAVAKWKDIPFATHLRMILEREHESPAYANLVRRSKGLKTGKRADQEDEDIS